MSLLHQTEEDRSFADGHAAAGLRKAKKRIARLERLLSELVKTPGDVMLLSKIKLALSRTYYDESDDE